MPSVEAPNRASERKPPNERNILRLEVFKVLTFTFFLPGPALSKTNLPFEG